MLAAAVAFPRAKTWGGVAGGFLAIFMAVLALATILAISSGHLQFSDAVAWGRMFALLLVFYVVVRLFPDRESLGRLMRVAVGAARSRASSRSSSPSASTSARCSARPPPTT